MYVINANAIPSSCALSSSLRSARKHAACSVARPSAFCLRSSLFLSAESRASLTRVAAPASQWLLRKSPAPRAALASGGGTPLKEYVDRLLGSNRAPLSDIVWTALGTFASIGLLAYLDKTFARHGLSVTMGSFGAVATILFATPGAPGAKRWNILVGHMGCALMGILALLWLGPGWKARAVALSLGVAFMQFTGSMHPPAAGVAMLFVDSARFHSLKWWYILFPGMFGCFCLILLQESIFFLKENVKF
eukprot:TRINITY_DN29635_c0_g1_i1.p1 TRINITY_DN29635_c0_g1~~TRINITY_DN29635_c0_g1_i1.p1  ORF type:complete len:288 (-),score=35.09 TRINITY_DN29635_c0_g1_i1:783-1529(-)